MTTYIVANVQADEEWGLLSGINQSNLKKEKHNIKIQKNLSKQMSKKIKEQNLSSKTYVISPKTNSNVI